ncbi:MAG: DUF4340 domain-containing protein, partial [Bacteroidota bacterium]
NNLKPERVAATKEDKWVEYKVVDSLGTRVKFKKGNEVLADLYLGKFSYQQAQNQYQQYANQRGGGTKMTTYVRLANENNVYAVNGFLSMTFNREPNLFRDKTLIQCNSEDLTGLNFTYPDSSFTLMKQEEKWMAGGLMADSASTVKVLRSLCKLKGTDFIENGEKYKTAKPVFSLKLEGNNMSPIEVKAYETSDSTCQFMVESSINPGNYMDGDKMKMFEKLYISKSKFFK